MATTLKVENLAEEVVTIKSTTGRETVNIEASAEAELEEKFLRSAGFRKHIDEGRVRLILTTSPSQDQYRLARRVMPLLLRETGTRIISIYSDLERSVDVMRRLRDDYNRNYDLTKKGLTSAKADANVADNLSKSMEHFLNLKIEEKLVADARQAITVLESEDTSEAGFDLADWFTRRQAAEAKLADAKNRLEAARKIYNARYKNPIQTLKAAAQEFLALNPATEIGDKLTEF